MHILIPNLHYTEIQAISDLPAPSIPQSDDLFPSCAAHRNETRVNASLAFYSLYFQLFRMVHLKSAWIRCLKN